jgi:hypothetical protein
MDHSRSRVGRFFLAIAGVAGGIHAGFSLFWAVGGTWLLDTVGEGAVEFQRAHPWGTAALLVVVGTGKAAGAVLPAVVEWRSGMRFRRAIRFLSWIGGCLLVVYGTTYAAVSAGVLAGAIAVPGGIDRRGMQGHAMLWDPLFAVWGATLLVGLWLTRRPRTSVRASERGTGRADCPDPDAPRSDAALDRSH